jgi:cytochrome b
VTSLWSGEPQQYIGHNPLARIGVAVLFLLLLIQVVTGLVLAGTDLFWPPFGSGFAEWVAAPGVDPSLVEPGKPDLVDPAAYKAMRDFRAPFVSVHEITFYLLAGMIVLHLIAVVVAERYEGGGITSAMITGRKVLTRQPPDDV